MAQYVTHSAKLLEATISKRYPSSLIHFSTLFRISSYFFTNNKLGLGSFNKTPYKYFRFSEEGFVLQPDAIIAQLI